MKSLVITLTLIFTSLGTAVEKPNVIFILADDVGIGDIKCFYPKSRVTTPNIDRLASQGMRFTQAYAPGAVCSPSRYALLTGAYPCRGPIRLKTANSYSPLTISSDSLTLPRFFKNSGYQTAHIGKWHLGFGNSVNKNWAGEISPSGIEIGFDYQFALPSNHNDGFKTYLENHRLLWLKDEIKDLPKKPTVDQLSKIRYDDEVDSTLTAKGIEFITTNKDRPFFLYLALTATHTHITPHKRFRGTSPLGQLGDYINELDFHVGEIMETLEKHDLEENTILFFSSDNGGSPKDHESAGKNLSLRDSSEDIGPKAKNAKLTASKKLGHKTNGDLRGAKGKTYEGGVRVPFIVRWPQKIAAGSQSDQLITLTDILATAAGFLGQNLPESAGVDSFDISPVILGKSQKTLSRTNVLVQNARGMLAFREGDWKLRFQKQPQWQGDKAKLHEKYELYNLAKDPAEQNDIAKAHSERAKAMVKNLTKILNNGRSR